MSKSGIKAKLLADYEFRDYKYTGCNPRKSCKRVRKTIRRSLKRKEYKEVDKVIKEDP